LRRGQDRAFTVNKQPIRSIDARVAVDSAYQKQGLGSALLKDALLRTVAAAQIAGIRAVLLHAMTVDAKRFYARAGFYECPVDPMMMMMITLAEVEKSLSPPSAS
jgi:GNAT superfamily N-acetyltransferase